MPLVQVYGPRAQKTSSVWLRQTLAHGLPRLLNAEDQDVQEAARLMEEQQLARLAVLNRDKQLVGIVSLGDLAIESGETEMPGGVLKKVKEGR